MSNLKYHLESLAMAESKDDPRQTVPTLPAQCRRLLDIGCGAGQTLLALKLPPGALACGIDIDEEALRLGRARTTGLHFGCAVGEQLPFRAQAFDAVISRVALPYMEIPQALAEAARVLQPGGFVWFTLHPFRLTRRWFWKDLRLGNWRGVIYQFYVMGNGLLFHFTGKQFRYPLKRQRCESFQTARGMQRALQQAGFEQIQVEPWHSGLIVTAVKAGGNN
jgi:ubiquinone/menaquinone biosynthesis C-methylase UbiE